MTPAWESLVDLYGDTVWVPVDLSPVQPDLPGDLVQFLQEVGVPISPDVTAALKVLAPDDCMLMRLPGLNLMKFAFLERHGVRTQWIAVDLNAGHIYASSDGSEAFYLNVDLPTWLLFDKLWNQILSDQNLLWGERVDKLKATFNTLDPMALVHPLHGWSTLLEELESVEDD